MKVFYQLLLPLLVLLPCSSALAQQYTVTGKMESPQGAALVGAHIFLQGTQIQSVSDDQGRYQLTAETGSYTLVASYVGFNDTLVTIELNRDLTLDIHPGPSIVGVGEVKVVGSRSTLDDATGAIELSSRDIKLAPDVMGESDLVKTVQLLPGVSSTSDGHSGFYVRGGGPDQNLVLLDGASIYNVSHLFGFFSIFNTESIDNIKLIKGSMPANYGGRLSSVLDITTITGNDTATSVDGSVGLIATKATVQGPLQKEKSSYFFSGRRTYVDLLAQPVVNNMDLAQTFGYFFYDLNGKVTFRLTDRDELFFSGYFGRDVFNARNKESGFGLRTSWGNSTAVVGYSHIFGDKLLLRASMNYTSYLNEIKIAQDDYEATLSSGINDLAGNVGFHYFPNSKHRIQAGINYAHHNFLPTNIAGQLAELETADLENQIHLYSHDLGIYALDAWAVNPRMLFEYGLRYSLFQHIGPFDRYVKGETNLIEDTISYSSGENIARYGNMEPRISVRLKTRRSSAWKLSFTQNYQYIHLASYSTVTIPTDVWIPSTDIVQPEFSTQYSIGNFKSYEEAGYELSLVGFYKLMKNQIEYKDGFTPEDEVIDNVDNNFVFGDGKALGAEFYLKKVKGKTTGWLGYTLSSTKRQFDDINNGQEFFAKYDRRHDLSVVIAHTHSEKWKFSTVFIYASGNATTMPIARYTIEGKIINEYGARNAYRMPAYHRLDISATYSPKPKKEKRYVSTWEFAIYNVYNRYNPYFIYFDNSKFYNQGVFETKAKLIALFPILPSVSWNFKF